MEPRLRTVDKAQPPYKLNKFPAKFIERFGEEISYYQATKESMSIEGNEWEQVFAYCVGADWKPSNVGLDDVVLDNCCWGAKTVFASSKNLKDQKRVRLICGRNSPVYSYGEEEITPSADPDRVGRLVLEIWNERVSGVRQLFKFVRTVVLVKSKDYSDYLIFETDTLRYDLDLYRFEWNSRGNLEGFDKRTNEHKFTWQPHGSQFTIIEEIPKDRLHLQVRKPERVNKNLILKSIGYSKDWVHVFDD